MKTEYNMTEQILTRSVDLLDNPYELNDAELDAVAAGSSLIEISHNNVEVGAQVQVLTNKSNQRQTV